MQHGLVVRCNQEHADAAWILKSCDSLAEAAYFESFFAAEYGLPTACFHSLGREPGDGRHVAAAAVQIDRYRDAGEAADGGSTASSGVSASPSAERHATIDDQPHDVLRSAERGRLPPGAVVVEPGRRRRAPRARRRGGASEQASIGALRDVVEGLSPSAGRREACRGDRRARPAPATVPRRGDLRPDAVGARAAGHGGARRAAMATSCRRSSSRSELVAVFRAGVRPRGRRRRTRTSPTACSCTTASTDSAAPTSGTSCSSSRRSPTSPRSCSTRTTAARRPSSTRPTRSSTTTPNASRRRCGPTSGAASASSATTPRTRATRRRGSARTMQQTARDDGVELAGDGGASTAPTPRAA